MVPAQELHNHLKPELDVDGLEAFRYIDRPFAAAELAYIKDFDAQ